MQRERENLFEKKILKICKAQTLCSIEIISRNSLSYVVKICCRPYFRSVRLFISQNTRQVRIDLPKTNEYKINVPLGNSKSPLTNGIGDSLIPPNVEVPQPPSSSKLYAFKKAAICSDKSICSHIGR